MIHFLMTGHLMAAMLTIATKAFVGVLRAFINRGTANMNYYHSNIITDRAIVLCVF